MAMAMTIDPQQRPCSELGGEGPTTGVQRRCLSGTHSPSSLGAGVTQRRYRRSVGTVDSTRKERGPTAGVAGICLSGTAGRGVSTAYVRMAA